MVLTLTSRRIERLRAVLNGLGYRFAKEDEIWFLLWKALGRRVCGSGCGKPRTFMSCRPCAKHSGHSGTTKSSYEMPSNSTYVPPTLVGVLFCKPRFDADITVWIGPRLLSSGLEVVDERLPLGITSGQLVLEHVSTDDMAKSTVYSLPPVRFFCQAHGDRVNHILTCSVPWSSRMRSSICASSQRWAMALR